MINVGIIGCGFVGGALKNWLENNNPECKLFISDPPKGYNDDLSGIDIAFLQIHVPTEEDGSQDLTLMKQLINEGTQRNGSTRFYLSEIGKYGTNIDLPFLYQRVSETNFCASATEAILRIEGLTTNSLVRITSSLPDCPRGNKQSAIAWCRILDVVTKFQSGEPIRIFALSNAVQFISRQTESADWLDRGLIRIDPPYRMSKRRLAALRSVRDLGINEWQTNYVFQAIRELESYPEADLPE